MPIRCLFLSKMSKNYYYCPPRNNQHWWVDWAGFLIGRLGHVSNGLYAMSSHIFRLFNQAVVYKSLLLLLWLSCLIDLDPPRGYLDAVLKCSRISAYICSDYQTNVKQIVVRNNKINSQFLLIATVTLIHLVHEIKFQHHISSVKPPVISTSLLARLAISLSSSSITELWVL